MIILVINAGSSSVKYKLFKGEDVLLSGIIEEIGSKVKNHKEAFALMIENLTNSGAIKDVSQIDAIGHRVVHGGEYFKDSVIIDQDVMNKIKELIPLAPLHNSANLEGIEVAMEIFKDTKEVAVFDTAFHQTIEEENFIYPMPLELYTKHKIRKYGFHGTSHKYITKQASKILNIEKPNLITVHLGNGASITAIKEGKSIDTSMGFTPLDGLMMGTRCGTIDPAIIFYLHSTLKLSIQEINQMLNKQSGFKGICGQSDLREVENMMEANQKEAWLAHNMYCNRIKKYIGSYIALLGNVDAIIFTGGVGENSQIVRKDVMNGLFDCEVDEEKNNKKEQFIHTSNSRFKIAIIKTDEEKEIAQDTIRLVSK